MYPSVYNRLMPIISRSYTWVLLGRNLVNVSGRNYTGTLTNHFPLQESVFAEMMSRLSSGDTSLLAEMHATTSGLKTLVTTQTIQDLETARRCLGGHGFSEVAGIGRIYAMYLPSAT